MSAVQSGRRQASSRGTAASQAVQRKSMASSQAVQPQRKGSADPAEEDENGWLDWID